MWNTNADGSFCLVQSSYKKLKGIGIYYNETLKDKESIIPFSFAYYVNYM